MLAAIRPDDVNLPLFLHVLGAMLFVGVLLTVVTALMLGRRAEGEGGLGLTRFGLRTVLLAGLPTYLLMRVGAQWTEAQEDLPPEVEDAAWLGIGYITADLGGLLVIVSMVLSAVGLRRLPETGGRGHARAVTVITLIVLAAALVAVWAMSTKPE